MEGEQQMVYVGLSGEDVPDTVLSHLKSGLEGKSFSVFTQMREDAKDRCKTMNRIRVSRFVVVILSDDFGGSGECLDGLVWVVKRMDVGKLRTIPIYYMMNESDAMHHKGNFGYLLDQLEKAERRKAAGKSMEALLHTEVRIKEWREALVSVTASKGFKLYNHAGDSLDSEFIEAITKHMMEGVFGSIWEPKIHPFDAPMYEDEERMKAMVSTLENMGIITDGSSRSEPDLIDKISEQVKEKLSVIIRTDFPKESPKPVVRSHVYISYTGSPEIRRKYVNYVTNSLATYGDVETSTGTKTFSEVMEDLWIAVVILSEDYAESTYFLEELVAIKKHADHGKLIILPIFYMVEPDKVKDQIGMFADSFQDLRWTILSNEDTTKQGRIKAWKEALYYVAKKHGLMFKLRSSQYGSIAEMVSQTVKAVEQLLSELSSYSREVDRSSGLGTLSHPRNPVEELSSLSRKIEMSLREFWLHKYPPTLVERIVSNALKSDGNKIYTSLITYVDQETKFLRRDR